MALWAFSFRLMKTIIVLVQVPVIHLPPPPSRKFKLPRAIFILAIWPTKFSNLFATLSHYFTIFAILLLYTFFVNSFPFPISPFFPSLLVIPKVFSLWIGKYTKYLDYPTAMAIFLYACTILDDIDVWYNLPWKLNTSRKQWALFFPVLVVIEGIV